jgi:tRNA(fMet)-specific endonuclease VapC
MYLIDTDILIYSLKNDETVKERFKAHASNLKAISVISYGEMYFGAYKSNFPEKNLAVVRRISEIFPVIDVSRSIMETFGELKAKLQKKGNTLSDMDLIIASTALSMNFTLVTNNVRHFKRIPGLTYENWKN